MQLNIASFLTLDYWFSEPPSFSWSTLLVYLLVLGLLFLLGIVCKVIASKKTLPGVQRSLFRRLGTAAMVGALVGIVLVFFRYEYIPFLSRRLWFGLWFVGLVLWVVFIIRFVKSRIARVENTAAVDPFLPQPKK